MDTALQSSVYVSSPEFAGWLLKRGFHVRSHFVFYLNDMEVVDYYLFIIIFLVAKVVEETMGCSTWSRTRLHG